MNIELNEKEISLIVVGLTTTNRNLNISNQSERELSRNFCELIDKIEQTIIKNNEDNKPTE